MQKKAAQCSFVSASIAAVVLLCVAAGSPAFSKEEAWTLVQESKLYGKQTVIVSKNMLRQIRPKKELVTCIDGKTGEVLVYNTGFKTYYKTDFAKYEQEQNSNMAVLDGYLADLPMQDSGQATAVAGIKAHLYRLAPGHRGQGTGRLDSDRTFSLSGQSMRKVSFWCSSELPLSPNIQKAIYLLYLLPPLAGVPLKLTFTDTHNADVTELKTLEVSRTTVNPELLKPPADYKRLKSLASVIHPATSNGAVPGLMKYFDVLQGSGLGAPNK